MIHSLRYSAILDANVLYPAPLRDFLLSIADLNLFKPRWTAQIHEEWTRNLLIKRPDLNIEQLRKTVKAMNDAFPAANIEKYETLIDSLSLPDPNDRHILAAGIRSKADVIVTFNLKDFPSARLKEFDIDALRPDEFIKNLMEINMGLVINAFHNQVRRLRNPIKTKEQVIKSLEKCGLRKCSEILKENTC